MREPGKKKIKLAKLLTEAGYPCDPHNLYPAEGWNRSSQRIDNDAYRWEGVVLEGQHHVVAHLYSYYTMTELIKTGVRVWRMRMDVPLWYQVSPKEDS